MPNTTNGVRGGPSRRSDQKKDQEPGSINSRDLSRRNTDESENPIDVLASSSEALQRLADTANYFKSLSATNDFRVVDDFYGAEIEKENTLRKLKETVEILTYTKSDELEDLRRQNGQLLAEQEDCQREKKKYQDLQEELKDQNIVTEATRREESERKLKEETDKLQKQSKKKKAEFEGEIKQKVGVLEDEIKKLSATKVALEGRCVAADEKLETKKQRHQRKEKSLEDEIKKLTEELKQLKAQFPVEGPSVEN